MSLIFSPSYGYLGRYPFGASPFLWIPNKESAYRFKDNVAHIKCEQIQAVVPDAEIVLI